jgi:hypothetical protein
MGIADAINPAGLTAAEAAERLAAEGPNALPSARRRGATLVLEVLREPMFSCCRPPRRSTSRSATFGRR